MGTPAPPPRGQSLSATFLNPSTLFGVEPWDGSVFLAISAVMLLTGVAASLIPARRATRVDPVRALRSE